MPGNFHVKTRYFFFHIGHQEFHAEEEELIAYEKNYNTLAKRGILLTHQNFRKKARSKTPKKIDEKSQGKWQK